MVLHMKFNNITKIKTLTIPQVKEYYFDAIFNDYDDEPVPVLRYVIEDEDGFHFISVGRMIYFSEVEEDDK